jgi:protein TonB
MRAVVSLLLAVGVNLALFYGIYRLVSSPHGPVREGEAVSLVEFVRLHRPPPSPSPPARTPEPPKPPPAPPPPAPLPAVAAPARPAPPRLQLPQPDLDVPARLSGGPYVGAYREAPAPAPPAPVLENLTPRFRVAPAYPRQAARAGIEGVVTVEFTIAADGSVHAPKVVKADPPGVFNRAVLWAIRRWRFEPVVVGGKPAPRRARQVIRFSLAGH